MVLSFLAITLILLLIFLPFIYCILTYTICAICNLKVNRNKNFYPVKSIFKESLLQYCVFIILPFELFTKWEINEGKSNKFVILLPGYSETQFIFWKIRKVLEKNNIGYMTMKYKPILGDLYKHSNDLKQTIDLFLKENDKLNIYILGHSMGGLIGRHFLENNNYNNVKSLIMIATPHKGTYLAKLGIGKSSKQLRPNSNFLKELRDDKLLSVLNIYSDADNLICPRSNALFQRNNINLENLPLHNSCLFQKQTLRIIKDNILYGKY
ncbi:MAG: alpha/beta fold hydrolase [Bacteroidales bacterium]|nr:alpha/beta fold hydrolase [Bacteroidales bacterium]